MKPALFLENNLTIDGSPRDLVATAHVETLTVELKMIDSHQELVVSLAEEELKALLDLIGLDQIDQCKHKDHLNADDEERIEF